MPPANTGLHRPAGVPATDIRPRHATSTRHRCGPPVCRGWRRDPRLRSVATVGRRSRVATPPVVARRTRPVVVEDVIATELTDWRRQVDGPAHRDHLPGRVRDNQCWLVGERAIRSKTVIREWVGADLNLVETVRACGLASLGHSGLRLVWFKSGTSILRRDDSRARGDAARTTRRVAPQKWVGAGPVNDPRMIRESCAITVLAVEIEAVEILSTPFLHLLDLVGLVVVLLDDPDGRVHPL